MSRNYMTRKEEIKQEAIEYLPDLYEYGDYNTGLFIREAFRKGAKWADKHPKSSWISVGERLPKINDFVIVRYNTGCADVAQFKIDSYGDFCFISGGRPSIYVSRNVYSEYRVTHWMPIPELLKGGEK